MKQIRPLALLLALVLVLGSLTGTLALAASTTAPATVSATAAAEETTVTPSEDEQPQKKSLGKQLLILLAFAAGVGLLAAWYGLTTMRYNREKMDDMTEESRKIIERMREKDDK